jgi:outer membrane protein assembly factor BamB
VLAWVPATVGVALAAPPAPGDWPQFQGSADHLGISADDVPPPLRQLWRFDPGDETGVSGAAIGSDMAVVVAKGAVYAVDVADGAERWSVHRQEGPIAAPAVGEAGGHTLAVFTEGAKRDEAAVVAVDAVTHGEVWRHSLEDVSVSGVTIDGDLVLLGDRRGRLYGFDLATGDPTEWSPVGLGARIDGQPAVSDGEVFVVTRDHTSGEVQVVTVDEGDGKHDTLFKPGLAAGTASIPTVSGNRVLFGMGSEQLVHAVDRTSGGELWSARTRDSFSSLASPAVADGRLFVVSTTASDCALYALDETDGTKLWDFQFQAASIWSSPVVASGTVYLGLDDGRVVGVDAASGVEVWEAPTDEGRMGPFAVGDGVLIASKRGRLGGLVAFGPDPRGRALHIESPTVLKPGTVLGRYAIAVVALTVVLFGAASLLRRALLRRLPPEDEGTPTAAGDAIEQDDATESHESTDPEGT